RRRRLGLQSECLAEIERLARIGSLCRRRHWGRGLNRRCGQQIGDIELLAQVLDDARPRCGADALWNRQLTAFVRREVVALVDADEDLVIAESQAIAVLNRVGAYDSA